MLGYTEEEVKMMIRYYEINVIIPSKIPKLIPEMMKEIMLRADTNVIKQLCLTSKAFYKIGKSFWEERFKFDSLPSLVLIKSNKDKNGRKLSINSNLRRKPKNIKKWSMAYNNMFEAHKMANYFVHNMITETSYTTFDITSTVEQSELLWLPDNFVYAINNCIDEISVYFTVEFKENREYYLELLYVLEESNETSENKDIKFCISETEFIRYLSLYFHYYPNFIINDETENSEIYCDKIKLMKKMIEMK